MKNSFILILLIFIEGCASISSELNSSEMVVNFFSGIKTGKSIQVKMEDVSLEYMIGTVKYNIRSPENLAKIEDALAKSLENSGMFTKVYKKFPGDFLLVGKIAEYEPSPGYLGFSGYTSRLKIYFELYDFHRRVILSKIYTQTYKSNSEIEAYEKNMRKILDQVVSDLHLFFMKKK